jgi:hypothetical protein
MNRPLLAAFVTFVILVAAAAPAPAQYGTSPMYGPYYNPYSQAPGLNPGGGPRLSPYLNLMRGPNTPAVNYFLGAVPEIERRRFQNQATGAFVDLAQRTANPLYSPEEAELMGPVSITGHPTAFMNTSGYFMVNGAAPLPSRGVPMSPLRQPTTTPTRPTTPTPPR